MNIHSRSDATDSKDSRSEVTGRHTEDVTVFKVLSGLREGVEDEDGVRGVGLVPLDLGLHPLFEGKLHAKLSPLRALCRALLLAAYTLVSVHVLERLAVEEGEGEGGGGGRGGREGEERRGGEEEGGRK